MKHIKPNCKVVNWKMVSKERQRIGDTTKMPCKFCKTHNVIICRCGFSWGDHPWFRDKENDLNGIEDIEMLIS
jgi:hypothetical protein